MERPQPADAVAGQKVLIVEDHETLRRTLRDWLATCFKSCRFMDAGSGEEALALSGREPPDIVLMDIGLPGMDGIQATREIKAAVPAADVVILTIHEAGNYRDAALAAGAIAFVPKRKMHADLIPVLMRLMQRVSVTQPLEKRAVVRRAVGGPVGDSLDSPHTALHAPRRTH